MDAAANLCALDPRGWRDRLWSWLGFGTCRAMVPDDLSIEDGYVPGALRSTMVFKLDWRDRLRVLVSGKAMADIATQTDVMPGRLRSFSTFSVLAPNHPVGPAARP